MKKTEDKKNKQAQKSDVEEKNYVYLDESVKNFTFADYVRVSTSPRGMLFSFGKGHPEAEKFVIFNEIYLPLDVAFNMIRVIQEQIDKLTRDGTIELKENIDASDE